MNVGHVGLVTTRCTVYTYSSTSARTLTLSLYTSLVSLHHKSRVIYTMRYNMIQYKWCDCVKSNNTTGQFD